MSTTRRTYRPHTVVCLIMLLLLVLTACTQSPSPVTSVPTKTVVSSPTHSLASSPAPAKRAATFTPSPTRKKTAPASYTAHLLLRGVGRPDDLAFDPQGHLLFSDGLSAGSTQVVL